MLSTEAITEVLGENPVAKSVNQAWSRPCHTFSIGAPLAESTWLTRKASYAHCSGVYKEADYWVHQ